MDKVSNYRLGLYEKSMPNELELSEKLRYAKKNGFDWLEISIDESDEKLQRLDWNDCVIEELQKVMNQNGIRIETMCLSGQRKYPMGSRNESIRNQSMIILKKAIKLAARLGIRIIQLAGYDVYYEEGSKQTRELFFENLKEAVKEAGQYGILLGFETMETPFMDTVEKAAFFVNEINNPYLCIYPDIGNLTNASKLYKRPVNDDLEFGKGKIVAAHLKETKEGIYREVPFGSGHTQYQENIEKLKSLGVSMYTAEFWYTGNADWERDLKEANAFLRSFLDSVFLNKCTNK